jgi:DNA helicase HerA-like ATPase
LTGGFRLAKDLALPPEAATWVNAFLAKRNAGKTYDAAVLAEELIKAGIPIVVIDGMGVWWGLRVAVRYEGDKQIPIPDKPGMPVVVFGGDHADLPLVPEKAALIARSIVESGISAIIDISQLSKNKSRRIVGDFLYELYRINKNYGIRHVMVEESDQWAPQKALGDVAYSLGAVDEVVRRGGNFNLGCTLITQRSAVLNKDVLTQADCLVVLRTLAPQDKKAIQAWVEEMTDEDRRKLG